MSASQKRPSALVDVGFRKNPLEEFGVVFVLLDRRLNNCLL